MLFDMDGATLPPREREMDQPFFLVRSGRSGKAGDADRDGGFAALERAFGHGPRDNFRHRVIVLQQSGLDAEQVGLRLRGISYEAALAAVAGALDVGEQ